MKTFKVGSEFLARFFAAMAVVSTAGAASAAASGAPVALREQAKSIFRKHCSGCHEPGKSDGDVFGSIQNLEGLRSQRIFVPGSPAGSTLLKRIKAQEMPPPPAKQVSAQEIAALEAWITAEGGNVKDAKTRSDQDVLNDINVDIASLPAESRRFMRYISLHNLSNEGADARTMNLHLNGVSKLLNSLSWGPEIVKPKAVGNKGNLLRIDLRDYAWEDSNWSNIESAYEFKAAIPADPALETTLKTKVPYIRGDWFIATASRPPLYETLLEMPSNVKTLEAQLDVDVLANIREGKAVRSGFNGSGVSKNNRIIERHPTQYGAYWVSYDFASNLGQSNIFERPLGPEGNNAFKPAGGEIIFNLPNGLQAYALAEANGARIAKAPNQIVQDPKRPDGQVENGVSCMRCHGAVGMINKADQVRAASDAKTGVYSADQLKAIHALYVKSAEFTQLMTADAEIYRRAVAKTELVRVDGDPITEPVQKYEDLLDDRAAASELGVALNPFLDALTTFQQQFKQFGASPDSCQPIPRQLYNQQFGEIVKAHAKLQLQRDDEKALGAALAQAEKTRKRMAPFVTAGLQVCSAPCARQFEGDRQHIVPMVVIASDPGTGLANLLSRCQAGEPFRFGNGQLTGTLVDRIDYTGDHVQTLIPPKDLTASCTAGTKDDKSKVKIEEIAAGLKAETEALVKQVKGPTKSPLFVCRSSCGTLAKGVDGKFQLSAFPLVVEANTAGNGLSALDNACNQTIFSDLRTLPNGEKALATLRKAELACTNL